MIPDFYKKRLIDEKIDLYLQSFGAIALVGPRFCGKTTSGRAHCVSEISIADSSNNFSNRRLAQASPAAVLLGPHPRLCDEWQEVPQIWDAVRFDCDKDNEPGKYILTGSSLASVKSTENIFHSGTGRIATLQMSSMSLFETKDSSGEISITDLFNNGTVQALHTKPTNVNDIIRFCIRGGWPKNVELATREDYTNDACGNIPAEYIKIVVEQDVYSIPTIKLRKREDKIRMAVKILGLFDGSPTNYSDYSDYLEKNSDITIGRDGFNTYIEVLKKLFVLYEQHAYDIPSKVTGAITLKTPKLRFADPSLAVAAANLSQQELLHNMDEIARLFDCLCVHDLKIYAESINAEISYLGTQRGMSADCIIELKDGRIGIFKHVLAAADIDSAIPHLVKIKNILTAAGKQVSFMCVVCGISNAAYTQTLPSGDNVIIAPLTTLAP